MAPNGEPPFWGPFFKGTHLPQNCVHGPHLKSERKLLQKHVHSPLLEVPPPTLYSPVNQC